MRFLHFTFITLVFVLFHGCTTIKPVPIQDQKPEIIQTFSHEDFNRVLKRFVDQKGCVNYTALKKDARDLEHYYLLLTQYSPDSHPEIFPTTEDKLAYWINAYNATVMKTVLAYYPINSVADVKPPVISFFMPELSGFFVFQRVTFGGDTTNLYSLENYLIRKRFPDPRIHFALNCASKGCPQLERQVFDPRTLSERFDTAAGLFLANPANFRIDHHNQTVNISSIFIWYEEDFTSWLRKNYPEEKSTLLNYISHYLSDEKRAALGSVCDTYTVEAIPYDWKLNDHTLVKK